MIFFSIFESLIASIFCRVWKSSADAALIAAKNLRFIHQPSDYFYLVCTAPVLSLTRLIYVEQDCGAGEWLGEDPLGYEANEFVLDSLLTSLLKQQQLVRSVQDVAKSASYWILH